MAITQSQYDEYEAAAVAAFAARQGASSITFSDQSVTFSKWSEIWEWLGWMKGQIVIAGTGSRTRYAATSKGTGGVGGDRWE